MEQEYVNQYDRHKSYSCLISEGVGLSRQPPQWHQGRTLVEPWVDWTGAHVAGDFGIGWDLGLCSWDWGRKDGHDWDADDSQEASESECVLHPEDGETADRCTY